VEDYRTYSAQLLERATQHRQYRSTISDLMVSASILERFEQWTPLNVKEAETFEWVLANPRFVDRMVEFVEEARGAGHRKLSCRLVVERSRWEALLGAIRSEGEFLINDHSIPYLARMVNEMLGVPFFTARRVEGEPQ
jgi:hypothetical protein